jgi:hypothetical protein
VGFAWAHDVAARPRARPIDEAGARSIYHRARQLDSWAGEDYEGSSVLAGAKAAVEFGYIKSYRWAFGLADLELAVGYVGPAVLGVDWMAGMSNVDEAGEIHATGDVMGGHAILCTGVSVKRRLFRVHNSWGVRWGVSGDALISYEDLDLLLSRRGEACVPVGRV